MKNLFITLCIVVAVCLSAHSYSQTMTTVTITPTNVSCHDGSNGTAKATPDGTGTYTYLWNDPAAQTTQTAVGLVAGNYTVTVIQNTSVTVTGTVTITEPTALVLTAASQTNVSCNGLSNGSISVNVAGGSGSYTYNWTPGNQTVSAISGLTAGNYTCTVTDGNSCTAFKAFTITEPAVLTASVSTHMDVSCNGGSDASAGVLVNGGTTPYSYNWKPGNQSAALATNLTAQTYTCYITDKNSCATSQTVTISQPAVLSVSPVSQTSVTCNGGNNGAASVSVSGGTTPYSYNWTPGNPNGKITASVTNLTANNYTCTVTDLHSCIARQTFNIAQPAAISISTVSQTNVSCNGLSNGAISVNLTGGTGTLTYNWKPGNQTSTTISGLAPTTYTLTVTDGNLCTASKTYTVTQPAVLAVSLASKSDVSCNGGSNGSASVSVSGGTAPYTYNWMPGNQNGSSATNLTAQTYTCYITDKNSCATSQTVTIFQPAVLSVSPVSQTSVTCNGGSNGAASVSVSGGTTPYNYNWTPGNPNGKTTASVTNLTANNYTCTVTDLHSCIATQTFAITQPAAIVFTAASHTDITCHGFANGTASVNPATGGIGNYTYDWTPGNPTGDGSTSVTGLGPGTYTCTVTDGHGCTATQFFTINEPNALVVPTPTTTSDCSANSGTATANPTGGTQPYTYTWSPFGGSSATATGLAAANYTITVYDKNGCSASNTVTISSSAINLTTSQTNIMCNGGTGSATAIVSSGTAPYTYLWLPSGGASSAATNLSAGNYSVTVTESGGCSATATLTITEPPALTLTVTKSNIMCAGQNNGTATANTSGGTMPYTYSWSGGKTTSAISGLSKGGYTVTVTDANGCSKQGSVTVQEPVALLSTITQTNACNSGTGTATINATGGTTPYTYSWNSSPVQTTQTAVGLPVGNYSVLVTDASGCTTFNAVSIAQLPVINLTVSHTDIACNGDKATATANASGGSGTLTYSWAPGGQNTSVISGLSGGTYSVTVSDANMCSVTAGVSITEPAALTLTVTKSNIQCNGGKGSASVNVAGGTAPYTYVWNTTPVQTTATVTGLDVGNYSITVIDAKGCSKVHTISITQPTALVMNTSVFHIYDGTTGSASATVSGGSPGYTYNWNTTPYQSTATVTGLQAGNYTLTVTDANGCTTANRITVIATVADNLAAGFDHSLAKCQSDVTAFGDNMYGQLGDGSGNDKDSAIVINSLSNVTVLEGGGQHTLALKNDGSVWAWGRNNNGQLGTGSTYNQLNPVLVNSINKVIAISGGNRHSIALKYDGTVWAWGLNSNGQIGDNTNYERDSPVEVYGLSNMIYVASGSNHSLAIKNDSTVWAWGDNAFGQLGDKSTTDKYIAVQVKNISKVIALDGGAGHTLALKSDGTVWSWGLNADGQLGDGTNTDKDTAVKVSGLSNIVAISAGDKHSIALRSDGTVWAWGLNVDGQLGDYTTTSRNTPVNVNGLVGITAIQAGGNHSLAIKNNGQVWTWGDNTNGELGDKSTLNKNHPVMTDMPCLIKSLVVTSSQVNIKCNGAKDGSATAMPSGGAAPYTYNWSTTPAQTTQTITGLAAGVYSVTVTDANSFTSTIAVTVAEPAAITASLTISNVKCYGANDGTATALVSGGTPNYQYLWAVIPNQTTATATGLQPGTYNVYIKDGNMCQVIKPVTITGPSSALSINVAGVINATSCMNNDGSIITTASGGTPNYNYAWSTTPVQTTATAAGLSPGTYTLVVTDANNCTASVSNSISCPTNVNTLVSEVEFQVYPNPSSGRYTVLASTQNGMFNVEVYTMLGENIYSVLNLDMRVENTIDISQQPTGLYFLHIITKDAANKYHDSIKKIIKN